MNEVAEYIVIKLSYVDNSYESPTNIQRTHFPLNPGKLTFGSFYIVCGAKLSNVWPI